MKNNHNPITQSSLQKSACANRNRHLFPARNQKERSVPNKYRNIKVEYNGKIFDSIKERDRYITLSWRFKKGEITEPLHHVEYILDVKDKICSYMADFTYTDLKTGLLVVEDVKSPKTRLLAAYRLKMKLMLELLGIKILER